MTHALAAVLFTAAGFAGVVCLNITVRSHLASILSALRGDWHGPRGGSGR